MTDAELEDIIADCKADDRDAQKTLFERYKSLFMGIAFRYTGDRSSAKDVVQESFITIFENLHTLKNTGSFTAWARTIVVNNALNASRRRQNRIHHREEWRLERTSTVEEEPVLAEQVESIDSEKLYRAVAALPDGYRNVFNLYLIEGYSHAEIADILDIEEGTSRSQLHKAKHYLKTLISKSELTNEY